MELSVLRRSTGLSDAPRNCLQSRPNLVTGASKREGARAIHGAIPEAPVLQLATLPLLGENGEVAKH
jgi:hypothetical protein